MEEKKEKPSGSRRSLRNKRLLIQGIGWAIAVVMFIIWLAGQHWLMGVLILYVPIWLIVRNKLARRLLKTTTCYECGTEIDLVDRWICGCGDVTRRHIISKCSSCKKWMSTFPCPSCETTLDV